MGRPFLWNNKNWILRDGKGESATPRLITKISAVIVFTIKDFREDPNTRKQITKFLWILYFNYYVINNQNTGLKYSNHPKTGHPKNRIHSKTSHFIVRISNGINLKKRTFLSGFQMVMHHRCLKCIIILLCITSTCEDHWVLISGFFYAGIKKDLKIPN